MKKELSMMYKHGQEIAALAEELRSEEAELLEVIQQIRSLSSFSGEDMEKFCMNMENLRSLLARTYDITEEFAKHMINYANYADAFQALYGPPPSWLPISS